jgi:type III secretory pathway component EscU|tara:strand:+ start:2174 stop:2356 length:183 start_codon:yes stop_codon:yes gene_type:complete
MEAESYDIGYFEGIRNAYRMFMEIHTGREITEVFEAVAAEMREAMKLMQHHQEEDDGEWD